MFRDGMGIRLVHLFTSNYLNSSTHPISIQIDSTFYLVIIQFDLKAHQNEAEEGTYSCCPMGREEGDGGGVT